MLRPFYLAPVYSTLLSAFVRKRALQTTIVVLSHTLQLLTAFLRTFSLWKKCSVCKLASFHFFGCFRDVLLIVKLTWSINIISWLLLSSFYLKWRMASLIDIVISVISHRPKEREKITKLPLRSRLFNIMQISKRFIKIMRVLLADTPSSC